MSKNKPPPYNKDLFYYPVKYFKILSTEHLQYLFDTNTAWDAEVPDIDEAWKLDEIKKEIESRTF